MQVCIIHNFHTAKPVITKAPTNLTVQALTNQTFSCSAVGFPRPKIKWIRQNDTKSNLIGVNVYTKYTTTNTDYGDRESASSLHIINVSPTEAAIYLCVATSSIGEATAHAHLAVYGKQPLYHCMRRHTLYINVTN